MSRLLTLKMSVLICLIFATLFSTPALATRVTLKTTLGDVVIDLFEEETPATVANFMNYVNEGKFENTFIHRSDPGFIIQGGGYTYNEDGSVGTVPADPPVVNEPGISNLRGTIAMAKLATGPDTATSQWFINLGDNSANLDAQNGGFTVFGEVVGDGMDVIDAIAALPITNANGAFTELPLIDYPGSGPITDEYLVMTSVEENTDVVEFQINAGLNDIWYNIETNGQGLTFAVFPDSQEMFVAWFTYEVELPDESVDAMLGGPGQRWLTAQGNYSGGTASLKIYSTEGGIFDSGTPAPATREDGTMVITFTDCNTATVTYDIPSVGRQGVIPVKRLSTENIVLCEALD